MNAGTCCGNNPNDGNRDLGTPVVAAADGTVVFANGNTWGGLVLRHNYDGNTFYSQYGHVQNIGVSVGQFVTKGQKVAEIGIQGTRSAHLHFEIRTALHPDPTFGPFWQSCSDPKNPTYLVLQNKNNVTTWYQEPSAFISAHGPYLTLNAASVFPNAQTAAAALTFVYNIENFQSTSRSVRLGASVRRAGSQVWIDDRAHDQVIPVHPGISDYSRIFIIPATAMPGLYDVAWTLLSEDGTQWFTRREDLAILTVSPSVSAPVISISPSFFAFGTVNIGSTVPKTFIIQNTGTATLTVTGVNISSTGDFDAVFPAPPFNINPGLTNTFTVFFHPIVTGLRQGTATLISNATSLPTTVALSGTGRPRLLQRGHRRFPARIHQQKPITTLFTRGKQQCGSVWLRRAQLS